MQISLQQKNRGFVILFAMLISAIVLLISTGVFHVIQKEIVLSSYARESQRAFYMADSALECALYADVIGIGDENPASPFSVNPDDSGTHHYFSCGGTTIHSFHLVDSGGTPGGEDGLGYDIPYVFRYNNVHNPNDIGCAYVLVEKNLKGTDFDIIETRITAIGFNVCVNENIPDFNDPTLLERRLSIVYIQ